MAEDEDFDVDNSNRDSYYRPTSFYSSDTDIYIYILFVILIII